MLRNFFVFISVLCLVSPLIFSILIFIFAPEIFEIAGVAIGIRVINFLATGAILTFILAGMSVLLFFAARRLINLLPFKPFIRSRLPWVATIPVFVAFSYAIALILHIPFTTLFIAIAVVVFGVNFPLAELGILKRSDFIGLITILTLPYQACIALFGYILYIQNKCLGINFYGYFRRTWFDIISEVAWVGVALELWWIGLILLAYIWPTDAPKKRNAVVTAARLGACLISFPIIALGFLSLQKTPVSSAASLIFKARNLYDIVVDSPANRLLVTQTNLHEYDPKPYSLIFSFNLDKPEDSPTTFILPTAELENIAINRKQRIIYHVDRKSFLEDGTQEEARLLIMDADTLKVKKTMRIDQLCSGSTRHAFLKPSHKLFVRCEIDNLLSIDLDDLEVEHSLYTGEGLEIVSDNANGVVYLNYNRERILEERDAKSFKVLKRIKGPLLSFRMRLAPKLGYLFVPSALESAVFVYSTPDLEFIRKIPTLFGQRPFAIDEENGLIIAGSYISGYLVVVDINTGKKLQRHYIGKYLRTIAVDSKRRQAFIVTPARGLFMLNY